MIIKGNAMVKENIIETGRNHDWGYVSNKSDGFWGLWWFYIKGRELDTVNLNQAYLNELYLQIEDNIIAVKMTGSKNKLLTVYSTGSDLVTEIGKEVDKFCLL